MHRCLTLVVLAREAGAVKSVYRVTVVSSDPELTSTVCLFETGGINGEGCGVSRGSKFRGGGTGANRGEVESSQRVLVLGHSPELGSTVF